MPALPEVESRIVLPGTSCPVRSASTIMRRTGRSLTEPPGLNHSAFAYTSTARGRFRTTRVRRSSGVLPIRSSSDSVSAGRAAVRLLVKEVDRFRVVPDSMGSPPLLDELIETGLLDRQGLRAVEPGERNVE